MSVWLGALGGRGFLLGAVWVAAWLTFLALGVVVAVGDFKNKKILHRDLLWGLKAVLLCYAVLLLTSVLGGLGRAGVYYHAVFYRDLLGYLLCSAAAAMALWWAEIWPAGDTKLFMLLSLLYPLMEPTGSQSLELAFLFALINTFIPASLAVFFSAARFIWTSRLKHARGFVAQMGWRVELDYLREKIRRGSGELAGWIGSTAARLAADPWELLKGLASWAVSLFLMALLAASLRTVVASAALRTLLCFAVLLLWERLRAALDSRLAWILGGALVTLLCVRFTDADWAEVWSSLRALSVFGLFLYLGIKCTMGAVSGQVVMLAMPVLGALIGMLSMIPWWGGWAWPRLGELCSLAPLAGLGAFFGLAFVFVRIWDNEEHPDIPPENILSFMVLHRGFLRRLKESPEFYDAHFQTTYADGLTAEQAEALKGWCRENAVSRVPLANTMAFSHWIFVGYLLTWALGGHVLDFVF